MNTLQLIIVLILFVVALYLWLTNNFDPEVEKVRYTKRRNSALLVLVVCAITLGYFLYTDPPTWLVQKSTMNTPNCKICDIYTNRSSNLRPYSVNESDLLANHRNACVQCSKESTDYLELLKKTPGITVGELNKAKQDAITATQSALLASNELSRIMDKLSQNQQQYRKMVINPTWQLAKNKML
jgi:hypothetical protein